MDKDRIPLHGLLDTALGFSLKDLVLKTPEDLAEFRAMLAETRAELKIREEAAEEAEAEKEGKKP